MVSQPPNEFKKGSTILICFPSACWKRVFDFIVNARLHNGRPGVLVERGVFLHEFNFTPFKMVSQPPANESKRDPLFLSVFLQLVGNTFLIL